jgi:hypothetical protein
MNLLNVEIATPRLLLLPISLEYKDEIFSEFTEEITSYMYPFQSKHLKKWADKNMDYKYIIYPANRKNIPSRKIPEALGGKVVKAHEKVNMSGKLLNALEYRIYQE